mgnify:CR=1 FL=1
MPHSNYYYSESEWNRIGCGELPPERRMTTFTTDDRKEAEKKQQELPPDWNECSGKWPFEEDDVLNDEKSKTRCTWYYTNKLKQLFNKYNINY